MAVAFFDDEHALAEFSPKFEELVGVKVLPGISLASTFPEVALFQSRSEIEKTFGSKDHVDIEHGSIRLQLFRAGDDLGLILESSSLRKPASLLLYEATHDVLTGLQNRRIFSQHIETALAEANRTGRPLCLLQIDLDGFKAVNDTLGHSAGDVVLQMAARRIEASLGNTAAAYRYAGDEFVVIEAGDTEAARSLAEALIASLAAPFVVNEIPLFMGGSIGIAVAPEDGADTEQLMKAADIALYAAKSAGRGCARFFDRATLQVVEERESLRRSLRTALERGELHLEYQPLIRPPGEVAGFEALLRWRHPEIGNIPPSIFIPLAEGDGLMDEIGRWVLREACREALSWPPDFKVAVNLSPAQFKGGGLTDAVAQTIDGVGISPERVELEITETVLLEETVDNLDILHTISLLRLRIVLDDFGTFYSSLSYLKDFPFDTLKIDRHFVQDLESDPKSRTIIRSVLDLAHGLGMSVTAEGVETPEQARWLADAGCDVLQGYLLGRPMRAEAIPAFLAERRSQAAPAANAT